jgi:hypothetical protein
VICQILPIQLRYLEASEDQNRQWVFQSRNIYIYSTDENEDFQDIRTSLELLREENLKKDAMIEKMRKEHMLTTTELEEKVKQLSHDKQLIELKASNDLRSAEQKFKVLQDKANIEVANIKARQQEVCTFAYEN